MKTIKEINDDAINSIQVDSTYELLDIHLYIILKTIYKEYSHNNLSQKQLFHCKKTAINKYIKESEIYNFEKNLYKIHIKAIGKTERLRIALRKAINESNLEKSFDIAMKLIELYSCEFQMWGKRELEVNKIE